MFAKTDGTNRFVL